MSILCVFMRLFFYSLYFCVAAAFAVVVAISCNKTSCHQLFRPQLLPGYLLLSLVANINVFFIECGWHFNYSVTQCSSQPIVNFDFMRLFASVCVCV